MVITLVLQRLKKRSTELWVQPHLHYLLCETRKKELPSRKKNQTQTTVGQANIALNWESFKIYRGVTILSWCCLFINMISLHGQRMPWTGRAGVGGQHKALGWVVHGPTAQCVPCTLLGTGTFSLLGTIFRKLSAGMSLPFLSSLLTQPETWTEREAAAQPV